MPPGRRRHAAVESAVFALAALLAAFLAYQAVKRRGPAAHVPAPAGTALPTVTDAAPGAYSPATAQPEERAARGALPRVKTDRVVKPRRNVFVPAPR